MRLKHLSIGLAIAFAMVVSITLLPLVAFAQDAPSVDGIFGVSWAALGGYMAIGLMVIEVAKRIAALTPGKRDDEIVGIAEKALRYVVDFVAGKTGKPSDPGLVKRE